MRPIVKDFIGVLLVSAGITVVSLVVSFLFIYGVASAFGKLLSAILR